MKKIDLIFIFIIIYVVAVFFTLKSAPEISLKGENLTAMCLKNTLPSVEVTEKEVTSKPDSRESGGQVSEEKSKGDPLVLIYHTHATESYLPSASGNYHTTKEENTVRDAGNVLEETLEDAGINTIHDKTIHDNPSYDNSYSRSYEKVLELLKKYPTIKCIIDLHRDATAGNYDGPVENVEGKNCAVYSYVLSNGTQTYNANRKFLEKLNIVAESTFDGFSGEILERPYWYNQELSGKAILIEMGNNRNNIKEVRRTAKIFGEILAKALE